MKLIIFLIGVVFCIAYAMWMIVTPQGYRDYLDAHPGMDRNGTWSNASDAKIRIFGVGVIVVMLACAAAILKLVGIL